MFSLKKYFTSIYIHLLQDVQTELDLAYNRLKGDDTEDRKQEKINKLTAQVINLIVSMMTSVCLSTEGL